MEEVLEYVSMQLPAKNLPALQIKKFFIKCSLPNNENLYTDIFIMPILYIEEHSFWNTVIYFLFLKTSNENNYPTMFMKKCSGNKDATSISNRNI